MRKFATVDEAKREMATVFRSKYSYEIVDINGDKTLMCATCLAYEDELWDAIHNLFWWLHELTYGDKEDDTELYIDESSSMRDELLFRFLDINNLKIEYVWDEY